MKKVSALILALTMCTAMLTACGGGSSTTTSSTGSAAPAPTTSAATSEAGADEGYKLVKEGTLTMATNAYFPPYEYYDGQDVIGIDADIAKAIADKMGLELKIEDMEFDSIITAVSTGKADLGLAGMTVTPDRQKNVDFSDAKSRHGLNRVLDFLLHFGRHFLHFYAVFNDYSHAEIDNSGRSRGIDAFCYLFIFGNKFFRCRNAF